MPLTNGSGFGSGSWIRILLFSSLTFKMPAKNKFFNTIFSAYDFLKLYLHHFSKIKIQKESQNSRNQGFGSIPLTSGSGSGSWRPQNTWIRWIRIRIRIRNTAANLIIFALKSGFFRLQRHWEADWIQDLSPGASLLWSPGLCLYDVQRTGGHPLLRIKIHWIHRYGSRPRFFLKTKR